MSRHVLTRDGVVVYDYTDAPIETPQPPTPVTPPTVPPGNPGAIQPPINWPQGQASSDIAHVRMPAGAIFTFEVPALHAGTGVYFTQGQDANTPPHCKTEFSVSQTPGVIYTDQGAYSYSSTNTAYSAMTIYRAGSTMPLAPDGQVWYLNIRWNTDAPTPGFSLQWAAA
jgi:hypothetical protein